MGSLMELSNVACLKLGCVSIENGCERDQPLVVGLSWDWFSWFPSLVYVPMCRLNKNDLNGFTKFIIIIWINFMTVHYYTT